MIYTISRFHIPQYIDILAGGVLTKKKISNEWAWDRELAHKNHTACNNKNNPLEFFERNYILYRDEKKNRAHKFA